MAGTTLSSSSPKEDSAITSQCVLWLIFFLTAEAELRP
jgi:hypothetical protein